MRFNKRKYRHGDKRTVKRFAILPLRVNSETIIWLEWYWSEEMYNIGWDNGKWINQKITLINPDDNKQTQSNGNQK
jgi:hypothetical protein